MRGTVRIRVDRQDLAILKTALRDYREYEATALTRPTVEALIGHVETAQARLQQQERTGGRA